MSKYSITIDFDKAKLKKRFTDLDERSREIVSGELLKDANARARFDTGEMIRSSLRASELKDGLLIWDTPYAKRVYFTGQPATDKNPRATLLWAEVAATENLKKYERMIKKLGLR